MKFSQKKPKKLTLVSSGIKKCEEFLHTLPRPSPVYFAFAELPFMDF